MWESPFKKVEDENCNGGIINAATAGLFMTYIISVVILDQRKL